MTTPQASHGYRTYLLDRFSLGDTLSMSADIRRVTQDATTMEAAAVGIVRHLYERCAGAENVERANVLVRLFKTHSYGDLEPRLQLLAKRDFAETPRSDMRCLVLLATAGDETRWNSRQSSKGHQVIPLYSVKTVEQAPMIARLFRQFGVELAAVIGPPRVSADGNEHKKFGVFHEEQAAGSPHIPAQQEFVLPYGVRSVLGFGGSLRSGEVFAVVMFSRVHINAETAERFKLIGLDVKSAIFRFENSQVFASTAAST